MGIKSIVCVFDGTKDELRAANAALELAKIFGAHVRFLHISHDPARYSDVYEGDFVVNPELIETVTRENKVRLKNAEQHIISLTKKHHIPIDTKELIGHHASAKFINKTGNSDTIIGSEGRASDIIILGNDVKSTDMMRRYYMIAALFNTGRPVLFLPSAPDMKQNSWDDEIVSIAWDGSLESARAIYIAMPILERAEKLYILTASKGSGLDGIDLQIPIIEYLAAHGLKPNYITLDCGKHSTAETILTKAKELGSDLLVMGAYGHSRFRELILGGFTLYMLENTGIPLLLVH